VFLDFQQTVLLVTDQFDV